MRERIRHELSDEPFGEISKMTEPESWYTKYTEGISNAVLVQEDIRFSRLLISSMLREAWDEERFYLENGEMEPRPNEVDRMRLIARLQSICSFTGLINSEEIRQIQEKNGKVSERDFLPKEGSLPNFENLMETTRLWRARGLKIGLFHGSFDPPTTVHLTCATEAHTFCDRLIIGFDGDNSLKKRKGETRPRYPLDWRRTVFGSFWMVDGTFVLRAESVEDFAQYAQDYRDLNVDYVFLSRDQDDKKTRVKKILAGGAKPIILGLYKFPLSATTMLKVIKERGW